MFKIIRRHFTVSVLIILCFYSAFIALLNGIISITFINNQIKLENKYAYVNELTTTIKFVDVISKDDLFELANYVENCNVYIENMEIYFEEIDNVYRPDIILSQNETLSLPTNSKIEEIPKSSIIAPKPNVNDMKMLTAFGEKLNIYDTIDTIEYPFVSGLFILNANDYFEINDKALLQRNELTIRIASNEYDVYLEFLNLKRLMEENIPNINIDIPYVTQNSSIFDNLLTQENLISILLFLFALINTTIISYYWVMIRRREISIRKAFGASNFFVVKLMSKELSNLISLSAFGATITQIFLWYIQGNTFDMQDYFFMIIVTMFSIILSVIITMIIPMFQILKIQPAMGVKS